jgi:DNA repair exonuclease SbcCD ATPase subunit
MKIRQIKVTDYRAIRDTTVDVADGGVIIKGPNGAGKTSLLRAIQAALAGQDIGPDAIRVGADKAEIRVDLDVMRVRRGITQKGNSLTASGPDGTKYPSPQTKLNELLGTAALDPIDFFLADAAKRRKLVLQAVRVCLTEEQIARWTAGAGPEMAAGLDLSNGLEALSQLRKRFYDQRAIANKAAKEASAAAERAMATLPPLVDAPAEDEAERARVAADRALEVLQIRNANAEGAAKALETNRRHAGERRARATAIRSALPPPPGDDAQAAFVARWDAAGAEVDRLRTALRLAEVELKACEDQGLTWRRDREQRSEKEAEATRLDTEAAELEADGKAVETVPADVLAAARAELEKARRDQEAARAAVKARADHAAAAKVRAEAEAAEAKAAALDAIVATLTDEAPKELATSPDMIPGLALTESGVTLDGIAVDRLSGAEQLMIAVELAKRLNAKAKILVCDALERLDESNMRHFVKAAVRDGWQLLCTRVTADQEIVIEAIEPDDAADGRAA